MRRRFKVASDSNESKGSGVSKLIKAQDPLSTREQEDVLRFFFGEIRTNILLLKVLAATHVVLVGVYVVIAFSGEQEYYSINGSTLHEEGGIGINNNSGSNRHRELLAMINTLAFLASATQLSVSGANAWWLAATLKVKNVEEIIGAPPRTRVNQQSSADTNVAHSSGGVGNTCPGLTPGEGGRRKWWMKSVCQYYLAFISLIFPTSFFMMTFVFSRCKNFEFYYGDTSGLAVVSVLLKIIRVSWSDLILISWQSLFHFFLYGLFRSMEASHETVLKLASLKYEYEKV